MIYLLFFVGIVGLATSTLYAFLAMLGSLRFATQRRRASAGSFHPPATLFKPLHGSEPDLEAHLDSFFQQDYPEYEILFCSRRQDDAGLAIARKVAARYPQIPVKFLVSGEPHYPNAKVWSLELMHQAAAHDIFVISDSDVSVTPQYLREVIASFANEQVGLVTCLYRGVGKGSLWSRLEGVGMSVEMSAGVLVARMFEGMKFALGPTMAVRRSCVDQFGGFRVLGFYHADDFMLGRLVAANGKLVVLSSHVVDHYILNTSFRSSMQHQIRWMKSTRFSRPKGHLGTALTFGMPYTVLAAGGALLWNRPLWAALFFCWGWLTRFVLALVVGGAVVHDSDTLKSALLYPLRDVSGFLFWAASYLNRGVRWRGQTFLLLEDGVMRTDSVESKSEALLTT
ncbi:MAG TPA: bacteriohopanetetrol glucosamine biosynthesis glycosyltransferase HpnI [Acidobacteriaceae bacterium]|jgi:ceramide glucosyltransferase